MQAQKRNDSCNDNLQNLSNLLNKREFSRLK